MNISKIQIAAILAVVVIVAAGATYFVVAKNDDKGTYENGDIIVKTPVDYSGNFADQTYKDIPDRVVAGCCTALNILLYLGLGDKIVGIYYMEEEVPESLKAEYDKVVKRIGSDHVLTGNISRAVLTDWEPDCIIGWVAFSDKKLGEPSYWNKLNCNVWALRSMVDMTNVDGMKLDYDNFGKVFNVKEKTDAFIKVFEEKYEKVKSLLAASSKNYAIFDNISTSTKGYWFYADSFMNSILNDMGAKNVFPGGKRVQAAAVYDKADQIDVMFVITYATHSVDSVMKEWKANSVLSKTPAIVNGNVYSMNLSVSYGSDPSLLGTLDILVKILS